MSPFGAAAAEGKSFCRDETPSCVTPLSQATRPPFACSKEGPGVFGALLGTLPSCAIKGLAQSQKLREARKLCIASDHIQLSPGVSRRFGEADALVGPDSKARLKRK